MEMTDHDLLAMYVLQKDESAFARIVDRYVPLVRGVAGRWLGPTGSADDISQTVFTTLASQSAKVLEGLSATGTLGPWLCRVTANAALQVRRTDRRRQRREEVAARSVWVQTTPSERREIQDVLQTLHEELHALPVQFQEPVVLCFLEGRTQERAAAALNVSRTTLKRRLNVALSRLRQRLGRRGLALPGMAAWLLVPNGTEGGAPASDGGELAGGGDLPPVDPGAVHAGSAWVTGFSGAFVKAAAAACVLAPVLGLAVWADAPAGDLVARAGLRPEGGGAEAAAAEPPRTRPEPATGKSPDTESSTGEEAEAAAPETPPKKKGKSNRPAPKARGNARTPQANRDARSGQGGAGGTTQGSTTRSGSSTQQGSRSGTSRSSSGGFSGGSARSGGSTSMSGGAGGRAGGSSGGFSSGSSRSGGSSSSSGRSGGSARGGVFPNGQGAGLGDLRDFPDAEELLRRMQREMDLPDLGENVNRSDSFHGSLNINGEVREFDNREEYEKARREAGFP